MSLLIASSSADLADRAVIILLLHGNSIHVSSHVVTMHPADCASVSRSKALLTPRQAEVQCPLIDTWPG